MRRLAARSSGVLTQLRLWLSKQPRIKEIDFEKKLGFAGCLQ